MNSNFKSYVIGLVVGALIHVAFTIYNQRYQYTCECNECSKWFKVVAGKELNEKQREYIRNFCACK